MESRRSRRYYVQAPVFFWWKDADGKSRGGEGMTRDFSTQAIFVRTRECPTSGDSLRLDVMLPSLRGTSGVRLAGSGVVLRVDYADREPCGFAVVAPLHSETRDPSDVLLHAGGELQKPP